MIGILLAAGDPPADEGLLQAGLHVQEIGELRHVTRPYYTSVEPLAEAEGGHRQHRGAITARMSPTGPLPITGTGKFGGFMALALPNRIPTATTA